MHQLQGFNALYLIFIDGGEHILRVASFQWQKGPHDVSVGERLGDKLGDGFWRFFFGDFSKLMEVELLCWSLEGSGGGLGMGFGVLGGFGGFGVAAMTIKNTKTMNTKTLSTKTMSTKKMTKTKTTNTAKTFGATAQASRLCAELSFTLPMQGASPAYSCSAQTFSARMVCVNPFEDFGFLSNDSIKRAPNHLSHYAVNALPTYILLRHLEAINQVSCNHSFDPR
ncbi:hypothetical protein GGU10DRAFT_331441 [Lentinula aff. detonsa]|uniref:Translocated intimin receptor C-terminal domain-containing protein n=1 Tax=Lentinula aff. detonsa TaxID=2804958 RepID=A0AA38KFZ4_9AGAR|nr:hypothetical protein GGU10DRAFT_331441 [Lentinula aff. detonsa]